MDFKAQLRFFVDHWFLIFHFLFIQRLNCALLQLPGLLTSYMFLKINIKLQHMVMFIIQTLISRFMVHFLITVIWNCIIRWINSNLQAILSVIFLDRPKARRRNSIPPARPEEPDTGAETNADDNGTGMEQAWNPRIISWDHIHMNSWEQSGHL